MKYEVCPECGSDKLLVVDEAINAVCCLATGCKWDSLLPVDEARKAKDEISATIISIGILRGACRRYNTRFGRDPAMMIAGIEAFWQILDWEDVKMCPHGPLENGDEEPAIYQLFGLPVFPSWNHPKYDVVIQGDECDMLDFDRTIPVVTVLQGRIVCGYGGDNELVIETADTSKSEVARKMVEDRLRCDVRCAGDTSSESLVDRAVRVFRNSKGV